MQLTLNTRFVKSSFVAGPALLVLSAMSFVFGIGLIPPGITSYVEGIFGSYALILFVPIYLYMGNWLWNLHKGWGTLAIITGLLGTVVGFGMEFMRVVESGLRARGAADPVFHAFYQQPATEFLVVALCGPLFPITSIILGLGFLGKQVLPGWISALLILAGIGFPLAQALSLEWALKITYPGACILWLVAFSWIGLKKI